MVLPGSGLIGPREVAAWRVRTTLRAIGSEPVGRTRNATPSCGSGVGPDRIARAERRAQKS
jgi:hypothetical protein